MAPTDESDDDSMPPLLSSSDESDYAVHDELIVHADYQYQPQQGTVPGTGNDGNHGYHEFDRDQDQDQVPLPGSPLLREWAEQQAQHEISVEWGPVLWFRSSVHASLDHMLRAYGIDQPDEILFGFERGSPQTGGSCALCNGLANAEDSFRHSTTYMFLRDAVVTIHCWMNRVYPIPLDEARAWPVGAIYATYRGIVL